MNREKIASRVAKPLRGRREFQTLLLILAGWVVILAALVAVLGLLHRIAPA